jgi:protein-L-isoaspartate(D-aspartate) O-methyltransferase
VKKLLCILLPFWVSHSAFSQNYEELRNKMVSDQIEARGITHSPTLRAMRKVQRHLFVPQEFRSQAYDDTPLQIGYQQTISQPYIVAYMTELLRPRVGDKVLEIGTGSGYQAAVLAEIVDQVYTIEIVKELGERTKNLLHKLGYHNVEVIIGDGYQGLEAKAPFDAIIVTAAAPEIPPPLLKQLKDGGRMVIPIGTPSTLQTLMLVEKRRGKIMRTQMAPVIFVPFTREKNK